eukprot:TRINITY_DN29270_c0_g1_i1.p1 TRINITY_DN29270_c0_g1~~TRINITY_DN29270_c0_g1_i1.p1  ORF type:complete len:288 (-),score=18.59 TRINITY_DN29270_c0_g1_i1:526-1389(-)
MQVKYRNILVHYLWIVIMANQHYARGIVQEETNWDMEALLTFHSQMSLGAKEILHSWKAEDKHPCKWQGVKCRNIKQKRRVTELKLDGLVKNLDINSTIPTQISQIRYLQRLSLYNVGAIGSLPKELSALHNLQSLDVGSFGQGTLPPEYSKLIQMESFHVDYGNLGGSLPREYSTWSQIKSFGVYFQELRGSLPSEYSTWKQLIEIYLGINYIQGTLPLEYTQLRSIETLDIAANSLSGEVPIQYSGIRGIVYVYPQSEGLCIKEDYLPLFLKEDLATDLLDLPRC